MKHCRACDMDISTPSVLCPLCGTPLAGLADADCAAVYPPADSRREYNFVKRLLLLLSVVGAAVCIAVNLLGAFIHPLRLQYVEFFGKFYDANGSDFTPLRNSAQYSKLTDSGSGSQAA